LVAALGSAVSMIIIWSYVPRHVKHVRSEDQNMANVFNMKQIGRLLGYPNAAYLMSIKIIVGESSAATLLGIHLQLYWVAFHIEHACRHDILKWATLQLSRRPLYRSDSPALWSPCTNKTCLSCAENCIF